jgi:hypothetical protein
MPRVTADAAGRNATSSRETQSTLNVGLPLTEVVLDRLGPPWVLWSIAWALTALLAPVALLSILAVRGELARVPSISNLVIPQATVAYAAVLCLFGVRRLSSGARALEPDLRRLTGDRGEIYAVPRNVTLAAPLVLTVVISIVNSVGSVDRYGITPSLVVVPLAAISLVPVMTFAWTYLELLIGLDRLGREPLALEQFPGDRSLGLSGVGSLAFSGFVILFAAAIPIFVTSSTNVTTVAASVTIVGVIVVVFFLSMWRLHEQMVAARRGVLRETRRLVAEAYAPFRTAANVGDLEAQAPVLVAAQGLEERAERLLAWPVDEAMTAWVAVIATGVVTSLIVRIVLAALAI